MWLYHLHYLDDLNAQGFETRAAAHVELVARWIADNPPGHGVGWEPYPLSLRIVNLVKWLDRQPTIEQRWLDSLATQAGALTQRVEYHLLGNHLFANGKALVFAGAFLDGTDADGWLRCGLAILDREIPEQFLADGGHFERSPMYHATLTADLCDLVQLADVSGLPVLREKRAAWAEVLPRALGWLDAMTHPDGEIALVNDAAFGIAPRPADLRAYAESLIGTIPAAGARDFALRPLAASGYLRVDLPHGGAAIVDAAPLGPDYLPAHGHADTLAFELSLFGQRVFIDSGTSCYGESEERLRQRGTAAHNTVTIDGENSSEVWGGFRVARRARPTLHEASDRDGRIVIDASHDGYRRLPGRNVHRRRFTFEPDALCIEDAIEGPFRSAAAYLHLHPDVAIEAMDAAARTARLRLAGGRLLDLAISGASLSVEPGTWHPRFGTSVPTRVFVLAFDSAHVTTSMRWRDEP
ncbi:MAG: heparinase II/III family protein [Burkholderiaceae bacterium]